MYHRMLVDSLSHCACSISLVMLSSGTTKYSLGGKVALVGFGFELIFPINEFKLCV